MLFSEGVTKEVNGGSKAPGIGLDPVPKFDDVFPARLLVGVAYEALFWVSSMSIFRGRSKLLLT